MAVDAERIRVFERVQKKTTHFLVQYRIGRGWWLPVGKFHEQEDAERHMAEIIEKGF